MLKMNVQENISPNVNTQTSVTDTENKKEEANIVILAECIKKTISDFNQQTLKDVNSQPLIPTPAENKDEPVSTTVNKDTAELIETSSLILSEFYERFSAGKTFQTLEELRRSTFEYGRKHNVALTTSKSDKTKVYLICKHGGHYRKNVNQKRPDTKLIKTRIRKSQKNGCCCLIYARCYKGSFWTIRKSIGEHNHPISEDPRAYAMYRSLEAEQLSMVHQLLEKNIGISSIVKSLTANGVNNIVAKDIENIQQDLKRKEAAKNKPTESSRTKK
ncbi:hypothetical protein MFLAVUS_005242 [Mucor flavus]|uniref:FAR1 domain-containing protein n=1 Tax=Mucor flavus TaxID=439312 RepID=A0ABP9YY55_9FUNG